MVKPRHERDCLYIGCQMTLMGSLVTYTARAGKEPRDGVVIRYLPAQDKKELVDCSSRRHVVVSMYMVNHKKPATLCLTLAVVILGQFLYFYIIRNNY